MGVFEESPGMHWQQQQQQQDRYLGSAHDPSRDLSPNLPVHSCEPSSMGDVEAGLSNNSSLCSNTSNTSSSGCSTPSSNNNTAAGSCSVHPCSHHRYDPPPHEPLRPKAEQEEDCEAAVKCSGCGQRIADRYYLLAVDRRWHAACLRCCQCRRALDSEVTCFARDGSIYCKRDYQRLFGARRCARCQAAISATELVMRARDLVFHVRCFACFACRTLLTKGDHFGMRDGAVFCRLHYELGAAPHPPPPPQPPPPLAFPAAYQPHFPAPEFHHHLPLHSPAPLPAAAGPGADLGAAPKVSFFNGAAAAPRTKGRPRKRKPKDLEAMTANLDLNADFMDVAYGRSGAGTPGMPGSNGQQRTKRMRTSFKHHQLRTMKSYFAINHNPDAKDLKQLSQKTGLPKRVLQVWFQNARAKWRRMVLKQEGKAGLPGDKCPGVDQLGDLEAFQHHGPASGDYRHQGLGPDPHSPDFMLGGASPPSLECT
ncbi:LIM/homeobox protein Lhx9-like isoform X2 [Bacillus rossius redtenbacheri]|uniref:LIM/homeobox protein Lhx9-like isoform X2 n=1 Tax=Bacillus rossius redtenbacheri TaxID=93214 RepID=UPI002FDE5535